MDYDDEPPILTDACIHNLPAGSCARCTRCPHGRVPRSCHACAVAAVPDRPTLGEMRASGDGGFCRECNRKFATLAGFEYHRDNTHGR